MKSILLFTVLSACLAACGGKETPPHVSTARPALTQIVGEAPGGPGTAYSGEVRAHHELALGFRIPGKIIARTVDAGTKVKAGQVLARLDPADAGLQAVAAQSQYQLAQSEAARYRELRSKGFVSQSALDVKEAALQAAKSQSGLAHNQSDYTALKAEHDGVVAVTLADVGQVVSAGQPVLRLAQSGEMEVAVEIPETQFAQRHVGDVAQVVLLAGNGEPVAGRLRELSSAADPVSRTYAARVSFNAASAALGMTARVSFNDGKKSELLIPVSAIYQQGKNAAVWIVAADGSISLRAVTVASYRDEGAVIAAGLSLGERIVSAGVHRLSAGDKIQMAESRL